MKIKHKMTLLLPTIPYGNVCLEVEGEAYTDNEKDIRDLKEYSKDITKNPRLSDISSMLQHFVENEIMDSKKAIEQLSSQSFKLKV